LATLGGTDLSGATLCWANLVNADLREANLQEANLINARLDGAKLTGAYLWETQRDGWSMPTEYKEGEFERNYAAKPRIILRYPGGIPPMDLLALPLVVERLQAEHPGSVLQIRSLQNDAGGASVTITVEDVENRASETFGAEVEALRGDLLRIQHRLRSERAYG
jgi:Pentapeptide repeats (8 copies)